MATATSAAARPIVSWNAAAIMGIGVPRSRSAITRRDEWRGIDHERIVDGHAVVVDAGVGTVDRAANASSSIAACAS